MNQIKKFAALGLAALLVACGGGGGSGGTGNGGGGGGSTYPATYNFYDLYKNQNMDLSTATYSSATAVDNGPGATSTLTLSSTNESFTSMDQFATMTPATSKLVWPAPNGGNGPALVALCTSGSTFSHILPSKDAYMTAVTTASELAGQTFQYSYSACDPTSSGTTATVDGSGNMTIIQSPADGGQTINLTAAQVNAVLTAGQLFGNRYVRVYGFKVNTGTSSYVYGLFIQDAAATTSITDGFLSILIQGAPNSP